MTIGGLRVEGARVEGARVEGCIVAWGAIIASRKWGGGNPSWVGVCGEVAVLLGYVKNFWFLQKP